MSRPVIGISGPDRGGFAAWWFTALAVRLQGGRPRRISPSRPVGLEELNGLVIGGGADIEPSDTVGELGKIRQAVQETVERSWSKWLLYPVVFLVRRLFSTKPNRRYDAGRDKLETSLIEGALAKGLPLLGICRGAQLINYVLHGTLYDDIREFYEEAPLPRSIFPVKHIHLETDSLLGDILGLASCRVNALHHQAIDKLGRDIRTSAREDNGLVQGIESTAHGFVIGVQWHPEYLFLERSQRRLFHALVDAAGKSRAARTDRS